MNYERKLISIAAIVLLFACNKYDNIIGGAKPVHELLTEKPWQLLEQALMIMITESLMLSKIN